MEQTIRAATTFREITLSTPPPRETVDESRQREGISKEIGKAMGGSEERAIHATIPLRHEDVDSAEWVSVSGGKDRPYPSPATLYLSHGCSSLLLLLVGMA